MARRTVGTVEILLDVFRDADRKHGRSRVENNEGSIPSLATMPNMSYCRFENTSKAMSDCLDAIMDGDYDDLTTYERQGLIDILAYCDDILHHREEIEDRLNVLQSKYD